MFPVLLAAALTISQPTSTQVALHVASVPFYSQFADITSPKWQKVGCGIASLAMVLDYYASSTPVNTLLGQGIAVGAYSKNGWTYTGLISVAKKYGFYGKIFDLGKSDSKKAFDEFKKQLKNGPVIASVHYKFDPKNPIPHLVVINSIEDNTISYNDPAAKGGDRKISTADFLKAWKKRFIVIRPLKENTKVVINTL